MNYIEILEQLKEDPITVAHNQPRQVEEALEYALNELRKVERRKLSKISLQITD